MGYVCHTQGVTWLKNVCPVCGNTLYRRRSTGNYHCTACKDVYRLVKVDKAAALVAGIRLMVRFRPMLVPEVALRLGISSAAVRYRVARSQGLYIFDGQVRSGTPQAP